jgi:hypothetical protein
MRRLTLLPLALVTSLVVPGALEAQFAFRGVEFWGGQFGWSGADAEGLDPGFRGSFAGWAEFNERLGVGLELLTGGFDAEAAVPSRWDETGISAAGRLSLFSRRGISPFIEGRFGWTRISTALTDSEGALSQFTENGIAFGGEVGVEIPLNRRARIVLAGGATQNSYGDAELAGSGIVLDGTSFSAIRWGFRAGISLGRTID